MSKKVVFNTWAGAFFNPGGGEVQLLNTKDQLQKLGCEVSFYNQWEPQRQIDVFHQFSIQAGVEYPMIEYRSLGKKVALSTIIWVEYPKGSPAYHYVHRILNLADVLLTNSDLESEKISRAFDIDRNKFHKVVNGVSQEYLDTKTSTNFRQKFNIQGDFILSIANIDRRKNTHALIQACQDLGKKIISIGHIRDSDYFNEFKNNYEGFIHLGPITDTQILKSACQQAELFALPSLCETPGIAALEAASQGAKILITEEGAAKEYFLDFATYANPTDLESIKSGIVKEINQSRDKAQIIRHIVQNYTWNKAAEQTLAGYAKAHG